MLKFGLIGNPVSHSESPRLFREAFPEHFDGSAEPWCYDLIEAGSFEEAWKKVVSGGYRAVNVTAPFKEDASKFADFPSSVVRRVRAANILVRRDDGIAAFNSDYLGVRKLISGLDGVSSVAVIGLGGAGRAALAAAEDLGLTVSSFHHDEIVGGVCADLIIYALPRACEGCERLSCKYLLEANYLNPCLEGQPGYISGGMHQNPEGRPVYISGREWLRAQAEDGFTLFF